MKKLLPLVILLAVLSGVLVFFMTRPSPKTTADIQAINASVEKLLVDRVLLEPFMIKTKTHVEEKASFGTYQKVKVTARCPLRFDDNDLKTIFADFVSQNKNLSADYRQISIEKDKRFVVIMKYDGHAINEIVFYRNEKPKIALIMDDWGYNKRSFVYLSKIKAPMAIAIIPGLRFSLEASDYAKNEKKEVLLHMPMQPKKPLALVKGTIMADMSKEEIKALTKNNLDSVPNIRGVNNHEGSLISENAEMMEVILGVLKQKGLFYIDSLTTSASTGYPVATGIGLKTNKRDIFIDNERYVDYIEAQLEELKTVAKLKSYAIGIGHDDPVTMKILFEKIPEMEAEGYEFVYPAEIIY